MSAADDMAAVLAKLQKKFGVTIKEAALPPDANADADADADSSKAALQKPKPAPKAGAPQADGATVANKPSKDKDKLSKDKGSTAKPTAAAAAEDAKKKESELKDGVWSGQIVTFKAHGKGEYRYNTGAYWKGECKAGKRQGLGEFINDDGARIEGFWRENMLNGKITIKFADGSVMKSVNFNDDKAVAEHVFGDDRQYKGEWLRSKMHGQGKLSFPSGESWEGTFSNNLLHGKSLSTKLLPPPSLSRPSTSSSAKSKHPPLCGDYITSAFNNGEPVGAAEGQLRFRGNHVYVGPLLDGIPHGEGTITFSDGDTFKKEFNKGAYEATRQFLNGCRYTGGMYITDPHGAAGSFTFADGMVVSGSFERGRFFAAKFVEGRGHYEGMWWCGVMDAAGHLKCIDGSDYNGEFMDDLYHGQGSLSLSNGDKYTGGFEAGRYHGRGSLLRSDGYSYEGEWADNVESGQGRAVWPDGRSYDGKWCEGHFDGYGSFKDSDGSTYVGEYAKNKKQGKGREEQPNGQYYDGSYENGLYHGVGEFAEEDGSLYSGTWLLGLRQGQGTQANNRERHEYSGTFEADAYHGSGKCTWVNGSVYEGAWVRGVPNGVGIYVTADGSRIQGSFENGLAHGAGSRRYQNDDEYIGEFEGGFRHGTGVMTYRSKAKFTGQFVLDMFSGQGELLYADGSVYRGGWQQGMRHGYGEFTEKNGIGSIVGTFVNGLPSGDAVRIMASGAKYSGGFVEGLYCGGGSALFFDGSHYEGQWDAGLRSQWGRWVHEDANQVAPDVLGKVFEAVKAAVGGDALESRLQHGHSSSVDGSNDVDMQPESSASTQSCSSHPPSPSSLPNSSLPPPDVLSNPVSGTMGGHGALDAGRAGNPSGYSTDKVSGQVLYLEGIWSNDQLLEGVGRMRYVNGDWYEGSIRDAKRHGLGVMLYADGSVFGGKWEGDLKADGVFIDGSNNWTCGLWDGFVAVQALSRTRVARDKCVYSGEIRQAQRYGRGHCTYDDGRLYIGEWRGDEWYGTGSLYMPDGSAIIEAHWMSHDRTDGSGTDANYMLNPVQRPLEAEFDVPALVHAVQGAFEEERALVAATKAAAAAAEEAMIAAEQLRLQTQAAERSAADAKTKAAAAAAAKGKGKAPTAGARASVGSSRATAVKPKTPEKPPKPKTPEKPPKPKTPESSKPKTPVASGPSLAGRSSQQPGAPGSAIGGSVKPSTPSALNSRAAAPKQSLTKVSASASAASK